MIIKTENAISLIAKMVGGFVLFAIIFKQSFNAIDYHVPKIFSFIALALIVASELLKTKNEFPAVKFQLRNIFSFFYMLLLLRNVIAGVIFFFLGIFILDGYGGEIYIPAYQVIAFYILLIVGGLLFDYLDLWSYGKLLRK